MEQVTVLEQNTLLDKLATDSLATGYSLNIVVLYEDPETRKWARDVYERAIRIAGQNAVRATWWKLDELGNPAVLAGAVSTAMRADVVVLAARATEALPLSFYVWAENWMSHRLSAGGALIALLSNAASGDKEQARFREYLRSVARHSRMELLLEPRELVEAACPTKKGSPGSKTFLNLKRRLCSKDFLTLAFAS